MVDALLDVYVATYELLMAANSEELPKLKEELISTLDEVDKCTDELRKADKGFAESVSTEFKKLSLQYLTPNFLATAMISNYVANTMATALDAAISTNDDAPTLEDLTESICEPYGQTLDILFLVQHLHMEIFHNTSITSDIQKAVENYKGEPQIDIVRQAREVFNDLIETERQNRLIDRFGGFISLEE